MNTQELKENLLSIGVNNYYKNKIDEIFAEYEQSQKAETFEKELEKIVKEETVIKKHITIGEIKSAYKDLHGIFDKKYMEEIESIKKEIETLNQKNKSQIEFNQVILGDVKGLVLDVQRLESIDKKEEPKQERFYHKRQIDSFKYEIIDRFSIISHDGLFSENQAKETCRILNEMEKSK